MKKIGLFLVSMCLYGYLKAAPLVAEAPIKGVGTPVSIAISSTTITKVPSSQLSGRMGIYISNPNVGNVAGFIGDCTSTALSNTIRPFQFGLSAVGNDQSPMFYVPIPEDFCLWLIALNTAAATTTIHYQEVKQ